MGRLFKSISLAVVLLVAGCAINQPTQVMDETVVVEDTQKVSNLCVPGDRGTLILSRDSAGSEVVLLVYQAPKQTAGRFILLSKGMLHFGTIGEGGEVSVIHSFTPEQAHQAYPDPCAFLTAKHVAL